MCGSLSAAGRSRSPNPLSLSRSTDQASVAQLAEHLICNQEVVGSIPTAGSTADHGHSYRQTARIETLAHLDGIALRVRSLETRHDLDWTEAHGLGPERVCTGRLGADPRTARILLVGLALRSGPTSEATLRAQPLFRRTCEESGGFPSGQRGQTVNLMATPSQVRILFPPPLKSRLLGLAGPTPRARTPEAPSTAPVSESRESTRSRQLDGVTPSAVAQRLVGQRTKRGRSSMVERQPSKLNAWVRFPSPAPRALACPAAASREGWRGGSPALRSTSVSLPPQGSRWLL